MARICHNECLLFLGVITMVKIAIAGAAGRMGKRITALAIESEQFDIVCALEAPGHQAIGQDIGQLAGTGTFGVSVTTVLPAMPEVLIDFTSPEGTMHWLEVARTHNIAMVIGTTGLTESQLAQISHTAMEIPIVHSPNMSVGANVLLKSVGQLASILGKDYDIEIIETHHRFKKDAPSGTAIALAKALCQATDKNFDEKVIFGRSSKSPRQTGEIAIHAIRLGDTIGEHSVHFGCLGETIIISHLVHSRDTFARGALRAAKWIVNKKPSLYTMQDVLFSD